MTPELIAKRLERMRDNEGGCSAWLVVATKVALALDTMKRQGGVPYEGYCCI